MFQNNNIHVSNSGPMGFKTKDMFQKVPVCVKTKYMFKKIGPLNEFQNKMHVSKNGPMTDVFQNG